MSEENSNECLPGGLYIVATPIGNLEDITLRALRILKEVDVLACEDTRHTGKLLERHGIKRESRHFSCHEHNEERVGPKLLQMLANGSSVALVSDAGQPGVNDPGYWLVSNARKEGYRVEVLPGPSAVLTALVSSGLPSAKFIFKGFPPRKSGKLRTFFEEELERPDTLIFFESPYRIGKCLEAAHEVLQNRYAAVCLELTKKFERIERGYLSELVERFKGVKVKGEIVVVIAGNHHKFIKDTAEQ